MSNIDKAIISVHCHNDLGLATANTMAGIINGARQVECTINGIGERAGNTSLEEVAMILKTHHALGYTTGINSKRIYEISNLVSNMMRMPVQPNKAIVGRNAFAHEAGIHQHGVLSNPLCYEIMTPESVGVPKNDIVLGKHSGRHALISRYAELGYEFGSDEINAIYSKFVELADKKKNIYEQDLLAIVRDQNVAIAA